MSEIIAMAVCAVLITVFIGVIFLGMTVFALAVKTIYDDVRDMLHDDPRKETENVSSDE